MVDAILSNTEARRLFLDRHLLLRSEGGPGKGADLADLIARLGFVQVDSVNTLARAHDLILWSRRGQYRPAALGHAVARDRTGFESWTHDASVIAMGSFPHWRHKHARDKAHMDKRWTAWRREGFHGKLDEVLERVAREGCCTSADVGEGEARGSGGWWDWHPSKTALEYLWRSGELAVTRREGFRKVYDLTERVIPAEHLNARTHLEETVDWACSSAMERLGFATSGELAAFHDLITPGEAKAWCAAAQAEGRIVEIGVTCADGSVRKCFSTPEILAGVAELPDPSGRVRLLSPFDPALRDRKRAERLFGFHYRIEIFVPAPQRVYGYYVFPMMQGDRLIGRVDARREGDVLAVDAFWPEAGVRMGKGRITALEAEMERAARFVGSTGIRWAEGWLRPTLSQVLGA